MSGSQNGEPENQVPATPGDSGARLFGRRRALQTPSEALHPDEAPPPPSAPNSERRPVLSAMSGLLSLSLVGALVLLAGVSFASRQLKAPGPLPADAVVYVAPGSEVVQIIAQLEKAQVVDQPTLMKSALWAQRKWSKVKAGEYLFKAHASLSDVIDTLVSGKQVLHSVTLPEGLTSFQIVERLRASDVLAGEIKQVPPEGSILPETYKVSRGTSRSRLLRKMKRSQDALLDRVWRNRAKDLPLKSKYELLTLASIIEKETGRADERTRVAAVFYNRLNKRMKLQSDPTIVYGLVGGKGTLGRSILKSEIRKPTPYNTYVIPGLPPGPIANPGRAALEAAANPSRTNDLYFVANGTGGHAFAETYEGHKKNVARWREIEKERAGKSKTDNTPAGASVPAGNDPANVDRVEPQLQEEEPKPRNQRRRRGAVIIEQPFGSLSTAFRSVADVKRFGNLSPKQVLAKRLLARKVLVDKSLTTKTRLRASDNRQNQTVQPGIKLALNTKSRSATNAILPNLKSKLAKQNQPKKFAINPGLASLDLKIIGVTPDVTDSPLDGPDPDDPMFSDTKSIAVQPMSPAQLADLRAQVARAGGKIHVRAKPGSAAVAASDVGKPGQPQVKLAKVSRRILDASEGTKLDPLLSRKWDLNAAHIIPVMK